MAQSLRARKQEKTLIFVHIPKTGGRTVEAMLQRQYPTERTYDIYGYGSSISEAVEGLKNLPKKGKQQIKLIKGHYQFGLHRILPQQCTYITLLRDPIDRVISHYYYILTHHTHPLHEVVNSRNLSLKDYVLNGISTELDNGQTRLISGMEHLHEFGRCDTDMLDAAKTNLQEHFAVAGLVERFDESLVLMKLELGWKNVYYDRRNVANRRPQKIEIPSDTLTAMRMFNELDLELYRYAEKRFQELTTRWAPIFDRELRKLKRQNHVYQTFAKVSPFHRYYGWKLSELLKKRFGTNL